VPIVDFELNQGEYTKALAIYDKTLAITLKTVDPNLPRTATTYNNMVLVYKNQGEYDKALEFYDKSFASRLKTENPPSRPPGDCDDDNQGEYEVGMYS
jgi:pentatricopeptide repeat protein